MISARPIPFDVLVHEAGRFLMDSGLEAFSWSDKPTLIRRVAAHFRTSYAHSEAVVDDLLDLGLLEANYGRFRVRVSSLSP